MGSATRSALAASMDALAAQRTVTPATGEALLAAARVIDTSSQLRSVLVDAAVPAAEKATLLARILPQLDSAATAVLSAATEERWSSQGEFVAGIEHLGIRAIALAEGPDAAIEDELFEVAHAVASNADLELAIGSKLRGASDKAALVQRLFGDKLSAGALTILTHLVQSPRDRRIRELLEVAESTVAEAHDRLIARVVTASPLSEAHLDRLAATIRERYGREPRIDAVVDPSLLGGVRVQVGDHVVDGTVAARLSDLRLQLAG